MKKTFIRQATKQDALYVAKNLIEADRAEVIAATGLDPVLILPNGVDGIRDVRVGGLADEPELPMLIWGVDPVPGEPSVGIPWMLCTPHIYEHPVELIHTVKREWETYHKTWPVLTNFTDARNVRHHRLLKWLGCHFVRKVPFGPASTPFIEFVSIR